MPEAVVDGFELVHIEQAEHSLYAAVYQFFSAALSASAVADGGQRVCFGQHYQTVFELLLVSDVHERDYHYAVAACEGHGARRCLNVHKPSGRVFHRELKAAFARGFAQFIQLRKYSRVVVRNYRLQYFAEFRAFSGDSEKLLRRVVHRHYSVIVRPGGNDSAALHMQHFRVYFVLVFKGAFQCAAVFQFLLLFLVDVLNCKYRVDNASVLVAVHDVEAASAPVVF